MPARSSFDYAVVRVVPSVERGEFINAGVVLFCRTRRFLKARIWLDEARLTALAPRVDVALVRDSLELIPRICAGGPEAGAIGRLTQAERFHWLVAPRSTTVQMSPVHCGWTTDPHAALDDLFDKMVCPP